MKEKKKTAHIACLVMLGALLWSGVTRAAEPAEYRLEVLILRHLNNESRSFEAPQQLVPVFGDAAATAPENVPETVVRWRGLAWSELALTSEYSRLRRSRDFRPLLLSGWTQHALASGETGWVPVRGTAEDGTRIEGKARLNVSRYLHLRLEIDAVIPDKGEFRLAQSRRIKSGELHYFDHPELGVLVRVIPEPQPEPENTLPPATAAAGG